MIDFYVERIKDGVQDINTIKPHWKTDVCVALVERGYWTIDKVPTDVLAAVRAKLIADGFITA